MTNRKTILVTGAAKRIGRAIAEHFLDRGFDAILHAHESSAELKSWLQHFEGSNVTTVTSDLSCAQGQQELVSAAFSHHQSLDLLVHNASVFTRMPFASISRHDFARMQALHVEAPFFLTQALLPMLERGKNPCVINIIDAMWQRPISEYAHYFCSKSALYGLTRALAIELAPTIRVNAVAPGVILFPPSTDDSYQTRTISRIPLQRTGSPADIAAAVHFIAEQAPYMTGEVMSIDGGRAIAP